jgi:hypothetical protein
MELFFIVPAFEAVMGIYGTRWADTVGFKATPQNGLIWFMAREKPRRDGLKRHIPDIEPLTHHRHMRNNSISFIKDKGVFTFTIRANLV